MIHLTSSTSTALLFQKLVLPIHYLDRDHCRSFRPRKEHSLYFPKTILGSAHEFRQAAEFRLSGVMLTQAGRELQSVVAVEPNHQFLEDLNEFFKKNSLQMTEVSSGAPYIAPG